MYSCIAQQNKGFSLIELLVSLSIFTIVITMAVGTLLVLIDANGKAQNMQTVYTNVLFALDSMTREIRTGDRYVCRELTGSAHESQEETETDTLDCFSGDDANYLSIVEGGSSLTAGQSDPRIYYYFDDDYYTVNGQTRGAILRRIGDSSNDWLPITSEQLQIETFNLSVIHTSPNDVNQARAVIVIGGIAGELDTIDTRFEIQSYITQRLLNI